MYCQQFVIKKIIGQEFAVCYAAVHTTQVGLSVHKCLCSIALGLSFYCGTSNGTFDPMFPSCMVHGSDGVVVVIRFQVKPLSFLDPKCMKLSLEVDVSQCSFSCSSHRAPCPPPPPPTPPQEKPVQRMPREVGAPSGSSCPTNRGLW